VTIMATVQWNTGAEVSCEIFRLEVIG